jgi:hypothetical protein
MKTYRELVSSLSPKVVVEMLVGDSVETSVVENVA